MKICTSLLVLLSGIIANGGTISISSVAPIFNNADLGYLTLSGATKASAGDPTDVWGDRPVQGQTFLTGSNAEGYNLSAISLVVNRNIDEYESLLRVGEISGTSFTELRTETGTNTMPSSDQDYVTFTLDAFVHLAANTTYGFDWGVNSPDGFTPYYYETDVFSDGVAYISGDDGTGNSSVTLTPSNSFGAPLDRAFHLDMIAVPEPSTLSLAGAAICAMLIMGYMGRHKQ